MCHHCSDDRGMPDDFGSRTVADAAAFQARYATPAEPDWPTPAELAEMEAVTYLTSSRRERAVLNGGAA